MPSPLPRQVRWNSFARYCSIVVGLPQITVGSAPALSVSRPAQRSLALQPADSPSRLMRPSTPEAPTALLPPPPLRLLPGGAIQFPGEFISRCGPVPFTAHCNRDVSPVDPSQVLLSCFSVAKGPCRPDLNRFEILAVLLSPRKLRDRMDVS